MKKTFQQLISSLAENTPDIPFAVQFWDGDMQNYGKGEPSFKLCVKSPKAASRVLTKGILGFGEEYTVGTIEVEGDFNELMRLGFTPYVQDLKLSFGAKLAIFWQYVKSMNTPRNSLKNISHHYDRGNDFFRLYLDETMTYSCAYFCSPEDSLEQAQKQKYEHICRKLRLKEGENLVDIGCGWGGMLIYAAKHYGIKGTGCTLSQEQVGFARQRIKEEGLEGRIEILLEDYRNLQGRFDKFVSIGMFEHVGRKYITTFMEKANYLLRAGGTGLLHTIGKELDTPSDPWTMTYIFPGAYIPALDSIIKTMGEKRLVPIDVENLRLHYAATLDEWAKRFESRIEDIRNMFDDGFVRMWRTYLNGSAAGFRWGELRLYQILFTKGLNNELPMTRSYMASLGM
ncbi:MAG: SAM-dependent methyltransferase [Syntrophus sp. (in: bacteria)]|nr:SAM-dependent methyltransferase [Syntrophus sp. (in: bacteria)]